MARDDSGSLRLSRQVYRLRLLGLALGSIAVGMVLYENGAPAAAWTLLAFQLFVWPHVAWYLARRSADPHRTERVSLTIDSASGGLWIALMHFNLLPSVLTAAMMSMDKIGWGPRFLARTAAAMAVTCGVTSMFTGAAFQPATSLHVMVASLPLMVAYPLAVAFAAYKSGKLARERNKAIEQMAALREQLAHVARVGTLGEMAAGLAHELNQPLASIHFEAAAALELPPAEAPDAMRQALTSIGEQSLRAGAIVKRMRTFARRGESKREPTDIRELISEVLALLAHDLRLGNVRTVETFGTVAPVLVDRIELQQVLVNLIRNAIEAMAAMAADARYLMIETGMDAGRVRVWINDTGPGIDPSMATRLFHPFHSTKTSGLGLGLSICQTLIEAHGGRIGTTPLPGGGAGFFFDLPPAPAGSPA
jgi:C4-dicarboxylate-specific signal transduction histidine kinase